MNLSWQNASSVELSSMILLLSIIFTGDSKSTDYFSSHRSSNVGACVLGPMRQATSQYSIDPVG